MKGVCDMQRPGSEQEEGGTPSMGAKASLERVYFQVYLQSKGLTEESLKALTEQDANKIRREAFLYASMKLAEEESRARFVQDIHGHKTSF
jgi:hypothetical protein